MWSISSRLRAALAPLVAGASLIALAGCAAGGPGARPEIADAVTPTQQYAVHVGETPERLALSVHVTGLSDKQNGALIDFAQHWHESGADAIIVETPSNSAEEGDARAAGSAVAAALSRMGVPEGRVRLADYDAGGQPGAPVVARFTRLSAVGPDCMGHWDNLTSTNANGPSAHFGCAVTGNFAALLADPRDLAGPAASQPADGVRRGVILDKYRLGQTTSSAKDDQASGAVSTAVH